MNLLEALLLFAFSFVGYGQELRCTKPPGQEPADLPKDKANLVLPADYSITVRFTDWTTNKTSKFVERNFTDSLVITRMNNSGERTWIKSPSGLLTFEGEDCSKVDAGDQLHAYNISEQLRKYVGTDASTFAELLQSVLNLNYNSTNLEGMPVRNGVQSLHVVGCLHNLTTDGTTHLEVDLTYAGPKAEQEPYSKDFKNPSIFTVNIVLYQDTNTTSNDSKVTILEHLSFDVVTLEKTDSSQNHNTLMQPRGVYCTNMEKKELPAHFPERFEADVEFTNIEKKTVDTIELMYDESQRIVVFAFDADKDADVPFLVNASALLPKEKRVRVVHDFNYGLEYVLSKDGRECYHVNPIQTAWADVNYTSSIIYMRSPSEIILEDASADAYYAGKVAPHGHQEFELYVSKKAAPDGECVIEFLYNTEDWSIENVKQQSLHSIVQYHKDKTGKTVRKTITTINSLRNNTQLGSSWTRHNVYPCLTDSLSENFFFVTIEKASMKSLKQIGVENVESSLVEAISTVANISVMRISQFLLKEDKANVHACFIVGEADNATAQTAYHREQKSVKEVHEILNATLGSHSLKLTVVKDNLETATLNLGGFGTISPSTEPHPPPSFNGYSGGSMFVLAMFSFIFGALIAVGSYVFYHKRQAIRGMAYQVFE